MSAIFLTFAALFLAVLTALLAADYHAFARMCRADSFASRGDLLFAMLVPLGALYLQYIAKRGAP